LAAGCGRFHKATKLPQPAANTTTSYPQHPPPQAPLSPSPESLPDSLPQPEPSKAPVAEPAQQTAEEPAEAKPEVIPQPEKRTPLRRSTPRAVEPGGETSTAAPTAPPKPSEVPQIAPILSDAQMKELNQSIEAALASTEQNLRFVRSRERNARQQTMLDQADDFARQARQFRSSDPVSAKTFADKADQLSRELVSTYR
jgi:hypothetical protein